MRTLTQIYCCMIASIVVCKYYYHQIKFFKYMKSLFLSLESLVFICYPSTAFISVFMVMCVCLCVVWLLSCYKFVYKSSHRWLYRACGPHSNTVCHARNTASRSLSLKCSLIHSLRMHVSSIQCHSFQVRSTSKTA